MLGPPITVTRLLRLQTGGRHLILTQLPKGKKYLLMTPFQRHNILVPLTPLQRGKERLLMTQNSTEQMMLAPS